MIGILMNEEERKEIEYLLKRELDELLYDFSDKCLESIVKRAMEERYQILFKFYSKVASPTSCVRYIRTKNKY